MTYRLARVVLGIFGFALPTVGCGDDGEAVSGSGSGSASGSAGDSGSASGSASASTSATSGGSSAGDSSGGTGTPQGCAPSRVEIDLDGETTVIARPFTTATAGEFAAPFDLIVGTDLAQPRPHHSLSLSSTTYAGEATIDLAAANVTYGLTTDDAPQVMVASPTSTAANVFEGVATGTVTVDEPGAAVGDARCGSFDLVMTWTDDQDAMHRLEATGTFATTTEDAPAPG